MGAVRRWLGDFTVVTSVCIRPSHHPEKQPSLGRVSSREAPALASLATTPTVRLPSSLRLTDAAEPWIVGGEPEDGRPKRWGFAGIIAVTLLGAAFRLAFPTAIVRKPQDQIRLIIAPQPHPRCSAEWTNMQDRALKYGLRRE